MEKAEMVRSLECIVRALQETLAKRYEEEERATDQIEDQDRLLRMSAYLKTRKTEEEKAIADFKDLCKRYLFLGHS